MLKINIGRLNTMDYACQGLPHPGSPGGVRGRALLWHQWQGSGRPRFWGQVCTTTRILQQSWGWGPRFGFLLVHADQTLEGAALGEGCVKREQAAAKKRRGMN